MISNVTKTNNGKRLLAAVAVLALALCVCVVAMPSDAEPASALPAADEDGVITLTQDVTLTQDTAITNPVIIGNHTLTIEADVSVDIEFTEALEHVFQIGTGAIVVNGGSLSVNADNAADYKPVSGTGNIVFQKTSNTYTENPNLVLNSGSLTVVEGDGVDAQMADNRLTMEINGGTASFNGNGMGPVYIVQNGGTVDFELKDGSISAYVLMNAGTMTVSGTNTSSKDGMVFRAYAMDIAAGATFNVNGNAQIITSSQASIPTADAAVLSKDLIFRTIENKGTINLLADGSLAANGGTITSTDGKINNFTGAATGIAGAVDGEIASSASSAQALLNETSGPAVVLMDEGSLTGTTNVPAGKTFIIGDDVTVGSGSTVSLAGTGSNVQMTSVAGKTMSFNGGTGNNAGSVSVAGFVGTITVTYGSADAIVNAEQGSTTFTGAGSISGTIDDGTIAAGATRTIENGQTLTVNGTLEVNGNLNVNAGATLVINGELVVSGAGDIRVDSAATFTVGEDATVNGVSAKAAAVTGFKNGHIFGTIAQAAATGDSVFYINGVYSADDTVSKAVTINLAAGAEYNGTISYQFTKSVGTPATTQTSTNSVTLSATADSTEQIIKTAGNVLTVSNATVTSVSGSDVATEVVLDNVVIETMTLSSAITVDGDSEVPNGEILTFDKGGKIVLADADVKLTIYGDVQKTTGLTNATDLIDNKNGTVYYTTQNFRNVSAVVTTDVDTSNKDHLVPVAAVGIASEKDLVANNFSGSVMYLTKDITIDSYIELVNVTIYTNGYSITVGGTSAGTLVLTNSTIDRDTVVSEEIAGTTVTAGQNDRETLSVIKGSSLEITDSLLFIEVSIADGASVDVDNADVTYDSSTSEVRVGYGTTLYFSKTAVSSINVYGNLVIDSNATLPATNVLNVWSGATMVVNGQFVSLGDVHFYPGSDVTISEGATFTLGDRNGAAAMVVEGNVTVAAGATFTVANASNTAVAPNSLDIDYSNAAADSKDAFTVEGTMAMNGTLSGEIQNKGTITFNGYSTDGVIVLYNGNSITITSVTTLGNTDKLTVTDAGITETVAPNKASNGNAVELRNVKGITISETVTSVPYTYEKENYRDYVSTMAISGTITSGDIIVTTLGDIIGVGHPNDKQYATVTVSGELVLGKDVTLTVEGTLDVSGTVTGTVADSDNFTKNKVTVNGAMTVTGTVTIADQEIVGVANVNAVWYVVTGTESETYTYTNFGNAVTAAPNADDDTITVVGEVEVTADVEVPAGITVEIVDGDKLVIADDVTVTVADGATVNGSRATIDVNGTLVSNDYAEDMNVRTIFADVVTTSGAVRTSTSLANAIAGAQPGDVITANGMITIESDLTIPEGVTVYTEYPFVVDGAKLTVDGTLQLDDKAQTAVGEGDAAVSGLTVTDKADSEVEVNGVLSIETLGTVTTQYVGADLDGAHFAISNGAFVTSYVSNVEFAAQTASNNDNLVGSTVIVKGIVAAGDVAFTAPEDATIIVSVQQMGAGDEGTTILTMGTMTLAGDVQFVIADSNTRVTGNVTALCGDGTANATVGLSAVMGGVFTIDTSVSEVTDGNEYELAIAGYYTGAVTVSAGEVTVSASINMGVKATMNVASGATMTIDSDGSIAVAAAEDGEAFVVDGTLNVENRNAFSGKAVAVNGTMNTDNLTLATTLRIAGVLNVNEDEVLTIATGGKLILGDKPDVLGIAATGEVNGEVTISSAALNQGYILAYAGADLTGAQIDVNAATGESDADSTAYYINGEVYATIVTADANNSVNIATIAGADGAIELTGLANSDVYWFKTADEAEAAYAGSTVEDDGNVNPRPVGTFDAVYTVYDAAVVYGVVSIGQGITMYIDGLVVTLYDAVYGNGYPLAVGTHTISIQANAQYTIENAVITFNGQTIQNDSTITVTADMNTFTLAASGATPADTSVVIEGGNGSDMGLTDYLLIILVILIVIMAIMVALRLMRS